MKALSLSLGRCSVVRTLITHRGPVVHNHLQLLFQRILCVLVSGAPGTRGALTRKHSYTKFHICMRDSVLCLLGTMGQAVHGRCGVSSAPGPDNVVETRGSC